LSKTKPAGTYRVFIFGESAALGDPEPAYGFSRILKELLEERCPGTKFEVINVAMTAISSHVILNIARDCATFDGDIWVIYMGNNEVIGPFGAGSVFGSKSPPLLLVRAALAAKRARLGQALDELLERVSGEHQKSRAWEGMKMMLDEQIRAGDPTLQRVYDHFGKNLEDILSIAVKARVKPIVCSVSSNLRDCPPFVSMNRPDLSENRKADWARLFALGTELELRKEYSQAASQYRQAAAIDNTYAELAFRMARCFVALGDVPAAREQFVRARDFDALRFRADSEINRIIRRTCDNRAAEGVCFFDSDAILTNAFQVGFLGEECFWDHVHFNFAGNYLVARGLADQVISLLSESAPSFAKADGKVLTEAECAERLAFTDWDRRLVLERMWRRVHEPPFTRQLDHEQLIKRRSGLLEDSERKTDPERLSRALETYRNALERHGDDWLLHYRYALLLDAAGDLSHAEQEWKIVVGMAPEYAEAWFKLGDLNFRQGKMAEAASYYEKVLQIRPRSFEAMNGLGLVRMGEGKPEPAARLFEQALRIEPNFAQAHVNLGLLSSQRGVSQEAEAHYRAALHIDPESAGAHINLANLYAAQKKCADAINHYVEAAKLQPKDATVHLGLANSLQAAGRSSEAVVQYQEALRLNPSLPEAHFNLGVALAKRGDLPGATTCFQEAATLNPQDPQAHLNLGVALAQQHRFAEAITQFEAVLRLEPGNAAARQYLQTAAAKEGRKSEP
jgi:Flp pilus assembly protein TadD